ncbi:MAG: DUF6356 family protein [Legionella sp.]|uniref:DUF6356 family protein n=1 Tax=Legionella sp. TaxID=459 RepID=UPI0028448977|nr:DUF6356 family protein [Legionella sp.]
MLKFFTEHPASANQTYWEHLLFAVSFGFSMVKGGCACLIHAIFPFLFQTTGSQTAFSSIEKYLQKCPCKNENDEKLLECIQARKLKK